jgi:co-chaperonin GroES (HSP10)
MMPYMRMKHDVDPVKQMFDEVGDLSGFEIFNNQVLLGVYIRPTKTASGLFITDNTRDEDKWQGKVGIVLKKGPTAFIDKTGEWFDGVTVNDGDCLITRPSDGFLLTFRNVLCKLVVDTSTKGRIQFPDEVW